MFIIIIKYSFLALSYFLISECAAFSEACTSWWLSFCHCRSSQSVLAAARVHLNLRVSRRVPDERALHRHRRDSDQSNESGALAIIFLVLFFIPVYGNRFDDRRTSSYRSIGNGEPLYVNKFLIPGKSFNRDVIEEWSWWLSIMMMVFFTVMP